MNIKKSILSICMITYLVNAVGCGVLLYPERQGQKSGRIDPLVAVLDGVGLFFFVIPGLVAFGIDFYQGTIYLGNGATRRHSSISDQEIRAIKVNGPMTKANIEAALQEATGLKVDLNDKNIHVTDFSTQRDLFIPTLAQTETQVIAM